METLNIQILLLTWNLEIKIALAKWASDYWFALA